MPSMLAAWRQCNSSNSGFCLVSATANSSTGIGHYDVHLAAVHIHTLAIGLNLATLGVARDHIHHSGG